MKYNTLKSLDDKYETPFYLMYPDVFSGNINNIREAFECHFKSVIVGYSFKTNYVPAICNLALSQGCFAEVVSGMEYEMALSLGFNPKEIIFNGPIKKEKEIQKALSLGSIVNLDSEYEIDFVINYLASNKNKEVSVGIRTNIDLVNEAGDTLLQSGLKKGRFGFTADKLESAITRLKNAGIKITSIHGHTSSSDRSVTNFSLISSYMLDVCKNYKLNEIEFFNIGGGFFGAPAKGIDLRGKPEYIDYANKVAEVLLKDSWFEKISPVLVIEPGVSVVANVFSVVTKVYQNKVVSDKNFIVTDTSVFDVKPSMHDNNLPFQLVSSLEYSKEIDIVADVVGSTCMEKDIILKDVKIKKPKNGDYIIFDGVGAYTIVFTPNFINYVPPILAVINGVFSLVRKKQTLEDILQPYIRES